MFYALGVLLIVIIILGALFGGKYFGDTIRKGCGCLVLLLVIIIGAIIIYISEDSTPQEKASSSNDYGYFIVKQNSETYTKPNKNSEISGYIESGQELYIVNVNKFNYFYEVSEDNGSKSYILKDNLRRKIE